MSSTLPIFRTEIHFDRFDLAAAYIEEFRVAKWLSVVRLQIVEDKGFVAAIEKFGQGPVSHGITLFLEWYRDGLIDAPFGNISSILP
jgi:hypothetical protein